MTFDLLDRLGPNGASQAIEARSSWKGKGVRGHVLDLQQRAHAVDQGDDADRDRPWPQERTAPPPERLARANQPDAHLLGLRQSFAVVAVHSHLEGRR